MRIVPADGATTIGFVLYSGGWRNAPFETHDSCGLFCGAARAEEAIIRAWQTEIVAQRHALIVAPKRPHRCNSARCCPEVPIASMPESIRIRPTNHSYATAQGCRRHGQRAPTPVEGQDRVPSGLS